MSAPKPQGFATASIHAGYDPDSLYGAINTPIYASTTFAQNGLAATNTPAAATPPLLPWRKPLLRWRVPLMVGRFPPAWPPPTCCCARCCARVTI